MFPQGLYIKPVIPCSLLTLLTASFSQRYLVGMHYDYIHVHWSASDQTCACTYSLRLLVELFANYFTILCFQSTKNSTNSQHNLCEPKLVNTQTKFTTLYGCASVFARAMSRHGLSSPFFGCAAFWNRIPGLRCLHQPRFWLTWWSTSADRSPTFLSTPPARWLEVPVGSEGVYSNGLEPGTPFLLSALGKAALLQRSHHTT